MTRRLATFLLVVLYLHLQAWPAAVRAEHPSVRRAQRAYAELRFENVLREIAAARRAGGLARADQIELTRLEAFTYAVYDDGPRAVDAFQRLLGLDPTWSPPADTSPKIRRYFQEATTRGARAPVTPGAIRAAPGPAPPAPDQTPPFYASAWFWGSVAGAVVAGVGVGILLSSDEPSPPRGNLGTVELP